LGVIYGKLIRFTPEPGRDLILELWRLYEIDNLKAVLRGIASGATYINQGGRYERERVDIQKVARDCGCGSRSGAAGEFQFAGKGGGDG